MYHNTQEYFGMQDKNKYVRIVKITATGQSTHTHTHLKVSTPGQQWEVASVLTEKHV